MSERAKEQLRDVPEVSGKRVVVALRSLEDIQPCCASSTRETACSAGQETTDLVGQLGTAEMRWM